jgi:hypothetical protein
MTEPRITRFWLKSRNIGILNANMRTKSTEIPPVALGRPQQPLLRYLISNAMCLSTLYGHPTKSCWHLRKDLTESERGVVEIHETRS